MVETSVRTRWGVRAPLVVAGLPEAPALLPGRRETVFLTLTNAAPILDEVSIQIEGLPPGWYSLPAPRLRLLPREEVALTLELHPPASPPPLAGRYGARLRVTTRGGEGLTLPFVLEVLPLDDLPAGGLEVVLIPQTITTTSVARLTIELSTLGNHERVVDLEITDAALGLRAELESDRVSVAPGEKRRVSATIRLRRRPLLTPVVETPFEVVVRAEADDLGAPLLVAPGTLIHKGPFAFVPGLIRGAVGWVVLGIALVIAVLAVVILLAPVVQEPTGPVPTPAPTAAPTLESPPEPTPVPPSEPAPAADEPPPDLSGLPAEITREPSTAATPAASAEAAPSASAEAAPSASPEATPAGTPAAAPQDVQAPAAVDVEATVQARVAATVAALPSPTVAPTPAPTTAPAASPSVAATAAPIAATAAATAAATTAAPTAAATIVASPSAAATSAPTTVPAAGPTAAASTVAPTAAPRS